MNLKHIVFIVQSAFALAFMMIIGSAVGQTSEPSTPTQPQVAKPDTSVTVLPRRRLLVPIDGSGKKIVPEPVTQEQSERDAADMKIGQLLAENPTVERAQTKLMELFPSMTPFEKIAAAPHFCNLTSDAQFGAILTFLKDLKTPLEAQEIFLKDILNRPPLLAIPALKEVIGNPKHPLSQKAKEALNKIAP